MIKVDLGRDPADKGKEGSPLSLGGSGFRRPSFLSDLTGLMIIAIGIALGFVPYLVVNEFKNYLATEHQEKMEKIAQNINSVQQEIQRYNPFKKELQSYEDQKRLVRDRLDLVNQLLSSRAAPVNALDAVGQSLPVRAWINSLSFTSNTQGARIRLSGQALSNEDVSDFVDKLSESIHFSEVKLDEMSTGKLLDTEVRLFSVIAQPKGMWSSFEPRAVAQDPASAAAASVAGGGQATPASTNNAVVEGVTQ